MKQKRKRDNCVSLLYRAENQELPQGPEYSDMQGVRVFVDFVTASPLWTGNPHLPKFIQVYSAGDYDASEAREPNEIWISNKHLTRMVVLHELAHFYPPCDGHGPRYVKAYLSLVANFIGLHYERIYRDAFKREGIRVG